MSFKVYYFVCLYFIDMSGKKNQEEVIQGIKTSLNIFREEMRIIFQNENKSNVPDIRGPL
jgi:hypothetical protein